MEAIVYEGQIPKSLRHAVESRFADRVKMVASGGGFNTESGHAYEVELREGWHRDGEHYIIEPTILAVTAALRQCKNEH